MSRKILREDRMGCGRKLCMSKVGAGGERKNLELGFRYTNTHFYKKLF